MKIKCWICGKGEKGQEKEKRKGCKKTALGKIDCDVGKEKEKVEESKKVKGCKRGERRRMDETEVNLEC